MFQCTVQREGVDPQFTRQMASLLGLALQDEKWAMFKKTLVCRLITIVETGRMPNVAQFIVNVILQCRSADVEKELKSAWAMLQQTVMVCQ
eukprot:GFYU01026187.1.p2 GENE.GFYU01026187.1~~GFYU01026187.1.p2  ORF type:complete len:102 (-),score=7.14 GFYU01026187.1:18-290(-)